MPCQPWTLFDLAVRLGAVSAKAEGTGMAGPPVSNETGCGPLVPNLFGLCLMPVVQNPVIFGPPARADPEHIRYRWTKYGFHSMLVGQLVGGLGFLSGDRHEEQLPCDKFPPELDCQGVVSDTRPEHRGAGGPNFFGLDPTQIGD